MKIEGYLNTTARMDDGFADIHIRDENGKEHQLDLPFADLFKKCGVPSAAVLDLLVVASLCYTTDKTVPRRDARDGWTRKLSLKLPVTDATRWRRVSGDLSQALTFLTGDEWTLHFYPAPQPFFELPKQPPLPPALPIEAVALFSGGLDSLAGAIDLLAENNSSRVLLVGHYDAPGPKKQQMNLVRQLNQFYPGRVDALHLRVAHRPTKSIENTLRSRSFTFLAMGLYAAQAVRADLPLHMFENGLIALNIPLTPSRSGSCSTRTMHPFFLQQIAQVVSKLGIKSAIQNPYALKTKGECVTGCAGLNVLGKLAWQSVSCSHGSRRQDWLRRSVQNCGYCVPCIFRRASMHAAGLDDGQAYGRDVLTDELTISDIRESANDLRAVTDFSRIPKTAEQLRKLLIETTTFSGLDAHAEMAVRGFAEVQRWMLDGAKRAKPVKSDKDA